MTWEEGRRKTDPLQVQHPGSLAAWWRGAQGSPHPQAAPSCPHRAKPQGLPGLGRFQPWEDGFSLEQRLGFVQALLPLGFHLRLPVLKAVSDSAAKNWVYDCKLRWCSALNQYGDVKTERLIKLVGKPIKWVRLVGIGKASITAKDFLKGLKA